MAKKNFFRDLVAKMDHPNTSIAADGLSAAECDGWLDTGSYSLNAILSGSVFKGMADNKCVVFAGPTATGKTFFALAIVKHFLDSNLDFGVIYYDSEGVVTKEMLVHRGIDPERVILVNVATIENFRMHAVKYVDEYVGHSEPPKMLMVLDSLGMLASNKAIKDSTDEKKQDTRDMTLQQVIKGTFRILRLKLAQAKIPMIITNHTYSSMDPYGEKMVMQGGNGPQYAADDIFFLTKKKDVIGEKGDRKVVGSIVHVRAWKSRNARENETVDCKISYDHGLDPYYGLQDVAERCGVLSKLPRKGYYLFGDQQISSDEVESGEAFKNKLLLDAVDSAASKLFNYGIPPVNPVSVSAEDAA